MDNNNRNTHSEADEFNAFNASSAPAKEAKKRPAKKSAKSATKAPKKKGSFLKKIDKKVILGAAVGVLVLLLVAVIVVFALSRDRHILRQDNAFLVYSDSENHYHLLANGVEIEKDFEGEVQLIVSADNSFAYVIDTGEDGDYVYLLKGKKLEPITQSGIDEAHEFAMLKPGLIYQDGEKIRMWNEKVGETTIARLSDQADDFMLSGDASTVVYTEPSKKDTKKVEFKLFRPAEGVEESLGSSSVIYTPVAISNYGDYVYASFIKNDVPNLCVFHTSDVDDLSGAPIADSEYFKDIIEINVKGNELLFYTQKTTDKGPQAATKLFRFDKDEPTAIELHSRFKMEPKRIDPDIVYFDNFDDVYLTASKLTDLGSRYIYRMEKYVPQPIANYEIDPDSDDTSTIDPSGRFLYYINDEDELIQMDLKDENLSVTTRIDDVQEFFITQKGNIYFLEYGGDLFFRKSNEQRTRKNTKITEEVTDISFYHYANTLYYTKEEAVSIYMTKEGSVEEPVKMDSTQVTSLPSFTETYGKQSYAACYSTDNDGGKIFFTANGKKFKLITSDYEEFFYNNLYPDF